MAKIERGRASGLYGMESHTATELLAWANTLDAQIKNPMNADDPKWLKRRADKLRLLARQKVQAQLDKQRLRKKDLGSRIRGNDSSEILSENHDAYSQ